MSERNDGVPAFPVLSHPSEMVESYGMSLRDYFAAKALQGLCSNYSANTRMETGAVEHIAWHAYQLADAMLKAREAK